MARRTVRVDIPRAKLDDFIALAEKIIEKHNADGSNSPLSQLDMAAFIANSTEAKAKRQEAKALHGKAEALMQSANLNLGFAHEQNRSTEGSAYNIMLKIRNLLLIIHDGSEEELNSYGFNVVIGKSNVGRKKKQ